MDLNKNYDRVMLVAFGAAALLGGGFLAVKASGFKNSLHVEEPMEKSNLEPLEAELPAAALRRLSAKTAAAWTKPAGPDGTGFPLFASKPYVISVARPDALISMNGGEPIRPPMANRWLVDYDLDYTSANVGEQDPDHDGYSNSDEFLAKTDPTNPRDMPDFDSKIYYTERLETPMFIRFTAVDGAKAMVRIITKDAAGADVQAKQESAGVGKTFGPEGRFKVAEIKTEMIKTKFGEEQKEVLVVEDTKDSDGSPLKVVVRENFARPSYRAKIVYTLTNSTFEVDKWGDFEIPKPPVTITLKELAADHIVLNYLHPKTNQETTKRKDLGPAAGPK